jgi:hypothetical protein
LRRITVIMLSVLTTMAMGVVWNMNDFPGPPDMILMVGDREQVGAKGTHCWSRLWSHFCSDSPGPFTPVEPLHSTPAERAVLTSLAAPPSTVSFQVFPVDSEEQIPWRSTSYRLWNVTREVLRNTEQRESSGWPPPRLDLPSSPGLYVVSVFAP